MKATAFVGSAAALAACTPTGGGATSPPRSSAAPPPTPPTPLASVTSPNPTPDSAATVLVKDVVEFELHGPYKWNGGSVTLRLHEGRLDGEPIYYVRTDTSDQEFAAQEGLVHVPLLQVALQKKGAVGRLFLFDGGAEGQTTVLSTGPGRDDFTPLYRVIRATFTGDAVLLESAEAVDAAVAAGRLAVEETEIVVNYPTVKWPAGRATRRYGRREGPRGRPAARTARPGDHWSPFRVSSLRAHGKASPPVNLERQHRRAL